jgi:hypothetical protein
MPEYLQVQQKLCGVGKKEQKEHQKQSVYPAEKIEMDFKNQ